MRLFFSAHNDIPVVLAVDERGPTKILKLISPLMVLPWGVISVEASPSGNGVQISETDSPTKVLGLLPCKFEEVENLWVGLLPLLSQSYLQGNSDGREAQAAAVTALLGQKDNTQDPPQNSTP